MVTFAFSFFPSQFFFTLSCADSRWDENFSTTLRKLGVTIEYEHDSDGVEKTLVIDKQKKRKLNKYVLKKTTNDYEEQQHQQQNRSNKAQMDQH